MLHTPGWASTAIIAANLLCAGFAVAAAVLWYRSAVYQAKPEDARQDGPEIMMGMNVPLIATLGGQGRLSRHAATMAACAASLQAIAAFLQTFPPAP